MHTKHLMQTLCRACPSYTEVVQAAGCLMAAAAGDHVPLAESLLPDGAARALASSVVVPPPPSPPSLPLLLPSAVLVAPTSTSAAASTQLPGLAPTAAAAEEPLVAWPPAAPWRLDSLAELEALLQGLASPVSSQGGGDSFPPATSGQLPRAAQDEEARDRTARDTGAQQPIAPSTLARWASGLAEDLKQAAADAAAAQSAGYAWLVALTG